MANMPGSHRPIRDRQGRPAMPTSASDAKSIGQVLAATETGRIVTITRYGQVKAVVLPVDQFRQLTETEPELSQLERDFEMMLAQMQRPEGQAAVETVFESTPHQLGVAALAAVTPRRRRSPQRGG